MKRLLVVLVATLVTVFCAVPLVQAQSHAPAATVRVVATGGEQSCSAVVIAPDYALTARHCLSRGLTVDGIAVEYVVGAAAETKDIGMVYAPGLRCPCASLGKRPAVGDAITSIGFPGDKVNVQKETHGVVRSVDTIVSVMPFAAGHPSASAILIFSDRPMLEGGESGGGLFALQNGAWLLVGINVIGVTERPGYNAPDIASGFTPVDMASAFLPRT
jgi:hypothetical protein